MSNSTLEVCPEQSFVLEVEYDASRGRFAIDRSLNKLSGVYLITNAVNGRQYVGSSSSIGKRLSAQMYNSRNRRIRREILAYGLSSFRIHVLDLIEDDDLMAEAERLWIVKLRPQYNSHRSCGTGRKRLSDDARAKISESNIGRSHSEQTREKISKSLVGLPSVQTGRKRSDETREKMRAGHANRVVTEEMRAAQRRGWADRRERRESEAAWMMAIMLHWGATAIEN